MKRVITITMDIDEAKHDADIRAEFEEDGKPKEQWEWPQATSTANALIGIASDLLDGCTKHMLEIQDGMKEENQ